MANLDVSRLSDRVATFKSFPLLLAIFLIAFAVRYSTKHELLFDPDSYWWYQLAMYFAGIRTEHFIQVDGKTIYELASYPTGRVLDNELLFLPFTIGRSYFLLGILGMPQTTQGMLNYMFFFGPFLGALTAVIAYILGKELTDSPKAGFLSAIVYSFAHFAMTRNTAGDTGQESLGTFLLFGMVYLFIRAVKQKDHKKQIGFSIAAGLLFLTAANTWGGISFYWGLLAASVLAYIVINVLINQDTKSYQSVGTVFSILVIIGVFIPVLLDIGGAGLRGFSKSNVFQNLSYAVVLIYFLLMGYHKVEKNYRLDFRPRTVLFFFMLMATAALIATGKFVIIEGIVKFVWNLLFDPEQKSLTGNTVAYYRSTGFQEFKSTFGTLLLAIPASMAILLYNFYKKRDFNSLLLIFFMFLGIVSFRWMIRNSYFLSFILPLYLGILYTWLFSRETVGSDGKEENGEHHSRTHITVALMVVVLFFISPVLAVSTQTIPGMKYSDQGVVPWRDAGGWLKKNTPEDALLIHWWDYGYHLQTFADRWTIVDGGNTNAGRNVDVAMAFTSPEEDFLKFIGPYNPDNRPIYVLVSIEEFGKSGAINFHASSRSRKGDLANYDFDTSRGGDLYITSFSVPNTGNPTLDQQRIMDILQQNRISTYFTINYGSNYKVWVQLTSDQAGNFHPEWTEKLLSKLLPFNTGYGQGLKHFQLVYQNGYVYIYKYVP
jgi:dolichyl-diphosphooligosaccharide--protein glycosyltransferase